MSTLEKVYKNLSTSFNLFSNSFFSILKIAFQFRIIKELPKAQNDRCAILGNGPSLNDSLKNHLNFIESCNILCVNHFAQSEYFRVLKPQQYVFLDGYYFLFDNKKYDLAAVNLTFEILKIIDWPINVFIPMYARNSYLVNTILKNNTYIKICYYNHIVVEGYNWFKFPVFKRGIGMPQCQNVLGASIFLSINIGYKDIYIFGADHSWHGQFTHLDNNIITMTDVHFYDKTEKKPTLLTQGHVTVAYFFLSLSKVFRGYEIINEYADYRQTKVYNASHKSFIDAFERKEIN